MTAECGGPRVGVGVMVVDSAARVLLTHRRRPPEARSWSILGGAVRLFERLEDCAVREAREEAGVDIVIERLLCLTDHIVAGEAAHWVSPAYLGHIVSGDPFNAEPEKAFELRWFFLDALPPNLTITARNAARAYVR
jgi:8-oxo-dGTP diphosphatase